MSDTAKMWRKRVASWRASGETAAEFSARHGLAANTLRDWSSRLRREVAVPTPTMRFAKLVRTPELTTARSRAVVVELLDVSVRITFEAGADRETLAAVLEVIAARGAR